MVRDEVVRYLEEYAASFGPPLVEGVRVTRLRRSATGAFELSTSEGQVTADQVVVAVGPYHRPSVPRMAERLPADVMQVHSGDYRSPDRLPEGAVLVVGTGQSGCQIAEDLHLAGRQVHLAVGGAPRVARFYRGRDCVAWLDEMGHYTRSVDEFADVDAVRVRVNHYVTGRDGGRDIDLRAFARDGMRLYGRLAGAGPVVSFADDLRPNLDNADAVAEGIKDAIDAHIAARGLDVPPEARYVPVWEPAADHPRTLDLSDAGVTSVV
jgi:putative flavoprotein involved in K+ transport